MKDLDPQIQETEGFSSSLNKNSDLLVKKQDKDPTLDGFQCGSKRPRDETGTYPVPGMVQTQSSFNSLVVAVELLSCV